MLTFRVGQLFAVLIAASLLVFSAMYLAPGSPETFLVHGNSVTPATLQAIRDQYHLDDPFWQQYLSWVGGLVHADFGQSIQFRQPVSALIGSRLPTTLLLIAYASLLIVVGGVLTGVLAAVRKGRTDTAVVVASTVAMSTPSFVVAIVMTSLFSVSLHWFPAFGDGAGLLDRLWHLTMPAIALAFSAGALVTRTTRSAMLVELDNEYVETARIRGLPERRIIWRQAFRNALSPVVTLAGLIVSGLLVTTTIVETAFGLNGVGSLLVQAVNVKDFPVVQAIVLVIVTVFALVNLLVDAVRPLIDPRARSAEAAR